MLNPYSARERIANLTTNEVREIILNWEQFEADGQIGKCALRSHAEAICPPGSHVVMCMERLAFEAYRRFAQVVLRA